MEVAPFGLEGVVLELHGKHADVDVRGKRLRAARADLRVIGGPAAKATRARQRRSAAARGIAVGAERHRLHGGRSADARRAVSGRDHVHRSTTVRIVHGHGTGQLRRAIAEFLKDHPLVAHFEDAPPNQGGGGVTVVELKD